MFGASSITTFVESASGAADGGRSGLTSITAGILFLLAAFYSPLISCISSAATCGALVYVGFLMMSEVTEIDWFDILEGFPTFMIIIGIPFTYSISNGIGLGFVPACRLLLPADQLHQLCGDLRCSGVRWLPHDERGH